MLFLAKRALRAGDAYPLQVMRAETLLRCQNAFLDRKLLSKLLFEWNTGLIHEHEPILGVHRYGHGSWNLSRKPFAASHSACRRGVQVTTLSSEPPRRIPSAVSASSASVIASLNLTASTVVHGPSRLS
ncbi:hypothetical protein [Luteibacter sp. CQ10]|uniref:hypothetical protein n=1 Tax=Luteibacter sp. CQ10 TaxID=2805821 RepID=UPI0034A370BF